MSSDTPHQSVLVVDDEPTSIQALGNLLKDNYRVQVANSGDRALATLQASHRPQPDLILLDIQMPGLDGYEVCRRLKADPQTRGIDVIFVSARNAVSDEEYGLSLGAVDYITKPFSPAIVRARVDTHMRLRHKTDLLEEQVAELEAQRQARDQALQRAERAEEMGTIGHWLTYPETGELIWSRMTHRLCGFDPEGPPPGWESFIARVPEADRDQVAEFQFQADPALLSSKGEYRIVHPGGRTLWVREIAQRWQGEHGQQIIQGTIQDITEQREALERSEAGRQRIEAILRAVPDVALTEVDLEGTVREANRSAERMFGYTRAQLIGSDICMLHDPDEHAQIREGIARLQETGEGYTTECELIRGSGERFQAQVSAAPLLNERGEVVGKIGACIDLSTQFAHEQRLRMAQEAAGFGVWDWDLAADQVYWDEACWRMLGYDPDQHRALTFADWQAMVHPEDLERVQPVVQRHLTEGRPFTIELRYRCADGGWLWVQGRGQTLRRGADGSPSYMVGTHVDVQTLKETEFALRRSELELTEAKRIARLGHWLYDIPCGTVHWSNEMYRLLGLEPTQKPMDWESFLSRVPAKDHPALHQAIDRTLNQEEPYEIEHRLTTPDGSQRIVQARGYAEFDAAGNPQILRGTAQDVTEQRTLQHELAERETHYRDLVENQPLMIERFLPDTTITYANPALAAHVQTEPDQLIGQRWIDFLPADERDEARAHLARLTPQEPVGHFENSIPGADGQTCWTLWTNRAFFDEHGTLSHVQSVGVDITARRRAEQAEQQLREQLQQRQQELEAIIEAASSVSLIKTDLNSVILEASTGAEALFGYDREELLGQHVSLLHTEADMERLPQYVDQLFREHQPIRLETELRRRDGSTFPALFTVHPITDQRGELVATLGVSFDISHQKRAERELAEAVEAKTTFLNAVSHDLRSPLNALTGFVELLAEPDLEEEQRQAYVQQCRRASGRLLELIDSLLDLSRLQAGRLELRPTPFDLHSAIEGQCTVYTALAQEHGLAFSCSIDPGVTHWVNADATRMGQILSNLLSNAIKYTNEGHIDLTVCTEPDERISFRVRDTGAGIPPNQQAHIFAAFDRAGYRGSRSGHGLGLAIVRELTELFGGEISLESTPGVGSTFTVTLPLPPVAAPGTDRATAADLSATTRPSGGDTQADPLRVLVADDQTVNVFLARTLLEQLGCTVTMAEDGAGALAAWQTRTFDALVLDRHMPGLDGDKLAEHIRAEEQAEGYPRVPIALYTAYARNEVEAVLESALFDAFLGKPLDRTELRQWIESLALRKEPETGTTTGEPPRGSAPHP